MITLASLPYPFYVVSNPDHLDQYDLSFAYHAILDSGNNRATCNDIPCQSCPFPCKDGKHRQATLIEFAKTHFPEYAI